ncbi:MAG: nucleotidyltransferase domain-containing protein [Rhodothermales bacterium]
MQTFQIDIPLEEIDAFCHRWSVEKLEVFGSVLRSDFGPDSDIDLMVTFASDAHPSLFDLVTMQDELEAILERDVDLIDRRSVEQSHNWVRRKEILGSTRPLYQAA